MDTDPDKWFSDSISNNLTQMHRIGEMLYEGRTQYQAVQVFRSPVFGISLALDGKIQSTELDEFIYHEVLVHPAMAAHPRPETVFIAGGGEGATLREVLSHNTVQRAVMVDIDQAVINLSRQYLPGHSRGAFEDRRTELHVADARGYLAGGSSKFDVIIIDLPDPIDEGPAYRLFTREFYLLVSERLTANGIISVQSGSASLPELLNLTAVYHTLRSVFPVVSAFTADIPCFGGPWGFCTASPTLNPALLTPARVDGTLDARSVRGLRFYDGLAHQGIFSLPRYLREALSRQQRLITDDEPLYIYRNTQTK